MGSATIDDCEKAGKDYLNATSNCLSLSLQRFGKRWHKISRNNEPMQSTWETAKMLHCIPICVWINVYKPAFMMCKYESNWIVFTSFFNYSFPNFVTDTFNRSAYLCLSGAVTLHSSSLANTFLLSQSRQHACSLLPQNTALFGWSALCIKDTPLRPWNGSHRQSISLLVATLFVWISLSVQPTLALQTKHEKHWNWNDMIVLHWNAIKLLMSSCSLCLCHFVLFCQYLLLQIPGWKII